MTYFAPRTWVLGESVNGTVLTNHLRDNLAALRNCNDLSIRLHRTAVFSVPNNSRASAIPWQATAYSTGFSWSAGAPTQVPVPIAGTYLLVANIPYANVAGGQRGVGWRTTTGGANFDMEIRQATGVDVVNAMDVVTLAAGDIVEVYPFQNQGAAINTAGTTEGDCWMSLSLLGVASATVPRWVPPRTWVSGDIISPAAFNTHIRDQIMNLRALKGCAAKIWLPEDHSIADAERGKIDWGDVDGANVTYNIGGLWIGGSQFKAPVSGAYLLDLNAELLTDGSADTAGIGYQINDSSTNHDLSFMDGVSAGQQSLTGGDLIMLNRDDIFEAYAYQDGGEAESMSLHGGTVDRTRIGLMLWAES